MVSKIVINFVFSKIYRYFKSIDRGSYLVLLGMLYATIFFCSFVMGYKTIELHGSILCASVFVFPLLFPLNDSITEILGSRISYFMIFSIIVCEFLFSYITYSLAILPSPQNWQNQEIYPLLTSGFLHIAIADSISLFIGFITNTYVLDKWGIRLFGSSFFMRSLGCTAIGELLFTISTNLITFHYYSQANLLETSNIIISDYLFKMIYSFGICVPNAYLVKKIKKMLLKNNEVEFINENIIPMNQRRVKYRT